jgi:ABC-type branched-subunit amino acid transport system substrate-binding protein
MIAPSSVTTPIAIETMIRKVKPKKVAVIMEKTDPAALAYADLSIKTLQAQKIDVESVTVQGTDVDFGPVVTRIGASRPELIIISTLDRAAVGLLKELRKARLPGTIMLTQSSYNTIVGQQAPELLENVHRFAQADLSISTDPRVKQFTKSYESKSGGRPPSFVAALPYDVVMITKHVIEKAGLKGDAASRADDRKKYIETLQSLRDYEGLAGKVSMAPEGFMSKPPMVLVYHGGKWDEVKSN